MNISLKKFLSWNVSKLETFKVMLKQLLIVNIHLSDVHKITVGNTDELE